MPKRRDPDRSKRRPRETDAPAAVPPAQSAVEQAIRSVLERLKPKPRPDRPSPEKRPKTRHLARPA